MNRLINDILTNINVIQAIGNAPAEINAISFDSRKVFRNDLFVAVNGTTADGHDFIDTAIEKGAIAILCETIPMQTNPSIYYIKVDDSQAALGICASNYYNRPSEKLKLVGVTGTNGKTTTATLLYQVFYNLGYKTGLLSTIDNYIHDRKVNATHTTPDPVSINLLLNDMVDAGCEYCFMEVSSHAIHQKRIQGLQFTGGIFTNISHDHLDYHKTFKEYIHVKKTFFDALPPSAFALVNADDKNGRIMVQNTKASIYYYGIKTFTDYKLKIIESHFEGMQININAKEVWTPLIGLFNAYNLLSVYATTILLGQTEEESLQQLSLLKKVNGRFEHYISASGKVGVIDYAHTPDGLKNVLATINEIRTAPAQIITVVGAGGDRDKSKRPEMGKIAAQLSDTLILTSDNPRSEDPEAIITDMKKGIPTDTTTNILAISNRAEAIKTACMLAKPKDIILVAGKGHEKSQEIKGTKHHFNDKEELLTSLKQ